MAFACRVTQSDFPAYSGTRVLYDPWLVKVQVKSNHFCVHHVICDVISVELAVSNRK